MHHKQHGFSLLELMIVIVIIGILAAIAVPSYSRYIHKSRASEAAILVGPVKTAITEYAILHPGKLAKLSLADLGLTASALTQDSDNVSSIAVAGTSANSATITTTLADNLGTLMWVATYDASTGKVSWACQYPANDAVASYAPKGCSAEAASTETDTSSTTA